MVDACHWLTATQVPELERNRNATDFTIECRCVATVLVCNHTRREQAGEVSLGLTFEG